MNKQELLEELKAEGFSESIISAFNKINREDFVPGDLKKYAYENEPLPIGFGATISQPYTIAFMLDLMELDEVSDIGNDETAESEKGSKRGEKSKRDDERARILEIGSGSGYVLALINEICKKNKFRCEIYGIEIIRKLVQRSKEVLKDFKNIKVSYGNGSNGMKRYKWNRILISASSEDIPRQLFPQLKNNGILVCPVRNSIFKITKINQKDFKIKEFPGFVFVPLV